MDEATAAWRLRWEKKKERRRASWKRAYARHLLSEDWRGKRAERMKQAGGMCEECGLNPALHTHHLRYPRGCRPGSNEWKKQERVEDLRVLCAACHDKAHRKEAVGALLLVPTVPAGKDVRLGEPEEAPETRPPRVVRPCEPGVQDWLTWRPAEVAEVLDTALKLERERDEAALLVPTEKRIQGLRERIRRRQGVDQRKRRECLVGELPIPKGRARTKFEKACARERIYTVEDLVTKSEVWFRGLENVGPFTMAPVMVALSEWGLSFGMAPLEETLEAREERLKQELLTVHELQAEEEKRRLQEKKNPSGEEAAILGRLKPLEDRVGAVEKGMEERLLILERRLARLERLPAEVENWERKLGELDRRTAPWAADIKELRGIVQIVWDEHRALASQVRKEAPKTNSGAAPNLEL